MPIDFKAIAAAALDQAESLVPDWLPGGNERGGKYYTSNLSGGPGKSLVVNLRDGSWRDFAAPDTGGGDLIALYAGARQLTNGEAAKELGDLLGVGRNSDLPPVPKTWSAVLPAGAPAQDFTHFELGQPTNVHTYWDTRKRLLLYVCVFRTNGNKQTLPYSWDGHKWRYGGWKSHQFRPLYGLDRLKPGPVMIVEGEKAADAGAELFTVPVLSWLGGSSCASKVRLEPLAGRHLILVPDADGVGIKAMGTILHKAHELGCTWEMPSVGGRPWGWDVADGDLGDFLREYQR